MNISYNIIQREATGDLNITENSQYNNVRADNVLVSEGVNVSMFGTISGKLSIGKGARVYLHGTLAGELDNRGGEFYRY